MKIHLVSSTDFVAKGTGVHSAFIGMIDLFDFNPQHKRAGIGIVIHPDFQQKGFASEALSLLIQYAFTHLQLHQLYANILTDNEKSLQLFEKQWPGIRSPGH